MQLKKKLLLLLILRVVMKSKQESKIWDVPKERQRSPCDPCLVSAQEPRRTFGSILCRSPEWDREDMGMLWII